MHNGVVLLLFDLPARTKKDISRYRCFVKHIKAEGFVLLQKSAYMLLVRNTASSAGVISGIKSKIPPGGKVCMLPMTFSEFSKIKVIGMSEVDIGFFGDDVIFV